MPCRSVFRASHLHLCHCIFLSIVEPCIRGQVKLLRALYSFTGSLSIPHIPTSTIMRRVADRDPKLGLRGPPSQSASRSQSLGDFQALAEFVAELKGQNIYDSVVIVTHSDFARTLTPNSGLGMQGVGSWVEGLGSLPVGLLQLALSTMHVPSSHASFDSLLILRLREDQ